MPERRALILTQHHMYAYTAHQESVRQEAVFGLDDEGMARFRNWLALNRAALMHLMVDLPDEGFHQETLPHVSGADRKALLTRKLNQFFFGTPYTLVRSLGREKQGRRDEHFLFVALTRPQALEPWLLAMHEAGVAIAGIHSPALLLNRLLDRQATEATRLILITLGSGGLRQSYFENGQLRFSRLKLLTTDNIEEAAVNTYGEAVRIYQYLIGQRLISRGNKVPVLCLASSTHFDLLRTACVDTEELSFLFGRPQDLTPARQLNLGQGDSNIDTLLVHMLLRQPPGLQFGNTEVRIDYRRWQWRNAIVKTGLAALGLSLAFVVFAAASIWLSRGRTADADAAAQVAKGQYETLVQSLPAIPITPQQLRGLIDQWQQLKTHSPLLAASLQPLSAALDGNPKIELSRLDWRLTDNPDDSNSAPTAETWLVMDIEAQLPASMGQNRRVQSEHIDHFVSDLKRTPADNARILQQPFDTDSAKALKGSSEAYSEREPANFSVRYWRRIGP